MKICNLAENSTKYTSNVYFVTGDWNTLKDKNTLIDVGMNDALIDKIYEVSTGVGQRKVSQVVLTHSHYDHVWNLPEVVSFFAPTVYAQSESLKNVHLVKDGQKLLIGDREFEVIYTPGHSSDSICLYCEAEKVLFTGDTPVFITSTEGSYNSKFLDFLERMSKKNLKAIYPGHGKPVTQDISKRLVASLANARS